MKKNTEKLLVRIGCVLATAIQFIMGIIVKEPVWISGILFISAILSTFLYIYCAYNDLENEDNRLSNIIDSDSLRSLHEEVDNVLDEIRQIRLLTEIREEEQRDNTKKSHTTTSNKE